MSKSKFPD